jgi:hypothetical protein
MSSLGVTAGFAAIGNSLKNFAFATRDMSMFSKEVHMSAAQLRAWITLGERFGISADQMRGSLLQFSDVMEPLKRRWGDAYGQLRAMKLGDLAKDLVENAPTIDAALKLIFDKLAKDVPAPEMRRRVLAILGLPVEWSGIIGELKGDVGRAVEEIMREQAKIGPGADKAAKEFVGAWNKMSEALENFKINALTPLLEPVTKLFGELQKPVNDTIADTLREFKWVIDGLNKLRSNTEIHHLTPEEFAAAKAEAAAGEIADVDGRLSKLRKKRETIAGSSSVTAPEALNRVDAQIAALEERRRELLKQAVKEGVTQGMKEGLIQKQSFNMIPGSARVMNAVLDFGPGVPRLFREFRPGGGDGGDFGLRGRGGGRFNGLGGFRGVPDMGPRESEAPHAQRGQGGGIRDGRPGRLSANQREAYAAAVGEGLSPKAARALVANMSGESLRNPRDHHWDKHHMSQGIVQWDPQRSAAIAKQFGKEPRFLSVADQTRAAIWEMRTKPRFRSTWRALQGDDERHMMDRLVRNYEAPANQPGEIAKRSRIYAGLGRLGESKAGPDEGAGRRLGDEMMRRSFQGGAATSSGATKVDATGSVSIVLSDSLAKHNVRVTTDGMFRDTDVRRGKQMPEAAD